MHISTLLQGSRNFEGLTLHITGRASGAASNHVNRASRAPVHVVVRRQLRAAFQRSSVNFLCPLNGNRLRLFSAHCAASLFDGLTVLKT